MDLIAVTVLGVARDPASGTPVVLLADAAGRRALPVWIGEPEAAAIALVLEGTAVERPLTHDLIKIMLDGLAVAVERAVITELRGGTFYARLILRRGAELFSIDARPSDSIAIALRAQAPVLAERGLLDGPGGVDIGGGDDDLAGKLRKMRPEDSGPRA